MTKLTVVGGGKMGEALFGGLVAGEWAPATDIAVVEPVEERRAELAKRYEGLVVVETAAEAPSSDVLIAVKPHHVSDVCATIGPLGPERVLSIAAGLTTAAIESWLPEGTKVVRVMPNTPSLVGKGMAAVAAGSTAGDVDLDWASEILAAVGEVVVVDEADMDAVTAVSGSGPAYVFFLAEAMRDAAIEAGLDAGTADVLTRQTILGAATLMSETGEEPGQLRVNVTSPGGTTAAALSVFEGEGLRAIIGRGVAAAKARSVELGS